MSPQQALQILSQLIAMAPVPLATHKQGQAALEVIQKELLKVNAREENK